jgi:hypothetical protein
MHSYQARKIEFKGYLTIDNWQLKVYTIVKDGTFEYQEFYDNVQLQLPNWLGLDNSFNSNHNSLGFLILHAGTEGIFSLINWWVGDNMLNTHIFKTDYNDLNRFDKISGDGLAPCIWELEIINHERLSWINQVLKKPKIPDFQEYLNATFSAII